MQSREQRISNIAQQIQQLTNELNELLLLNEQEPGSTEGTATDQAPPNITFLTAPSQDTPVELGDTVELINRRDRLYREVGQIVKVTAQQFAIRLDNYPNNPRPTYRYKDKVRRVRIADTRSQ